MTTLKYLSDTYLFESDATFIEIREHEKGLAVILDETIFYPQGGGQPADQGEIISPNAQFIVRDVRLDETGTVLHFGEFLHGEFQKGEKVHLKLNSERRILHAKLHSGGHLLDCAVTKLGIKELKPAKGYHFPDGPYVEYEGMLEYPEELLSILEKTANDLIAENIAIIKEELSCEEATHRGIHAPPGKSARIVNLEGYEGCGCGGTHVNRSSEIGKINIRKIKSKGGKTSIAYSLA